MNALKVIVFIFIFTRPIISFSQNYIPGQTYYDETGYVEYRAGNLPIILSSPHGGALKPAVIPDRDCSGCSYLKDSWTKEITEGMYDVYVEETGLYPHVIINLLHRSKFDANRDIGDAADGNETIEDTWQAYHDFIDVAKSQVVLDYDKGLFLDMHGHAHSIERIELGYLLSASDLRESDAMLDTSSFIAESSMKHLINNNIEGYTHSTLLRGANSFGSLIDNEGFPVVPSMNDPFPNEGESYFSGGYNTTRHGARDNDGTIDAIQIELNSDIRFSETNRELLITSLITVINQYINYHYNNEFLSNTLSVVDIHPSTPKSKIYPNPASSYFNLDVATPNTEVIINNSLGQSVYSGNWKQKRIEIDFLPNGVYFIQLKKSNVILENLKLVKKE